MKGFLRSSGLALLLSTSGIVHAQATTENAPGADIAPDDVAAVEPVAADSPEGREIVVTGSRIQRAGFQAPTPVTVIGSDDIQTRASPNIADVLSTIPTFRQTSGTGQSQRTVASGGGQSLLDLRGLGPNRTLTLVDTQRMVPSNVTGTYNVNQIPTFLIERTDVVTGGASAAYGSDAVAGVVNFILRRDVDGIEIGAQTGFADAGDNLEYSVNLAAGHQFLDGRLRVMFGVDYSDSEGVNSIYSRDWGRREPGIFGTGANRPAGVPAQLLAINAQLSNLTPGGLINSGPLRGTAFGPGGAPFAFPYGTIYSTWMVGSDANYQSNTFGRWNLRSPIERLSSLARISFEVSDALTLTATGGYAFSQVDGDASYHQWPSIVILADNPFIPDGIREQMEQLGLASITIGRNSRDINDGFDVNNRDRTIWGSLSGSGRIGGGWRWDAYVNTGRTKYRYDLPDVVAVPNFWAAIYAVPGPDGSIVCGPLASNPNLPAAQRPLVDPGCVPINLFGEGSPSPEAIDYVTGRNTNVYFINQTSAAVNVQGPLFSLWSDSATLAVGAEWRRESISSINNPLSLANGWYTNNQQPLNGGREVKEAYAELNLPIVRDVSLIHSLELNGAVRRTDYEISGSVTTWKAGIIYDLVDGVRFRATRSRDIRAPTLNELFSEGIPSRAGLVNPFNGASGTAAVIAAGNSDLVPEVADTLTLGVVLRPRNFLSGLQLSADYYDIKVDGVIAGFSPQQILAACFDGVQQYCDAITFDDSVFGISEIVNRPFNANQLHTRGIDFEAAYRTSLAGMGLPGQLSLRGLATWVDKLETTAPNGVFDYAGVAQNGVPEWSYNIDLTYSVANTRFNARVRGFSGVLFDRTLIGPDDPDYSPTLPNSINDNTFPARAYLDLGIRHDVLGNDRFEVFFNVDNVLNSDPPQFAAIAINSGGNPYDLIGRSYRAGFRVNFGR